MVPVRTAQHSAEVRAGDLKRQKAVNVFRLPYDFLNVFFFLAYLKDTVYNTYDIQNTC